MSMLCTCCVQSTRVGCCFASASQSCNPIAFVFNGLAVNNKYPNGNNRFFTHSNETSVDFHTPRF